MTALSMLPIFPGEWLCVSPKYIMLKRRSSGSMPRDMVVYCSMSLSIDATALKPRPIEAAISSGGIAGRGGEGRVLRIAGLWEGSCRIGESEGVWEALSETGGG